MQNTSISPNISMAAFQENKVGIWSSFGGTDTFRKCKSEKDVFKIRRQQLQDQNVILRQKVRFSKKKKLNWISSFAFLDLHFKNRRIVFAFYFTFSKKKYFFVNPQCTRKKLSECAKILSQQNPSYFGFLSSQCGEIRNLL